MFSFKIKSNQKNRKKLSLKNEISGVHSIRNVSEFTFLLYRAYDPGFLLSRHRSTRGRKRSIGDSDRFERTRSLSNHDDNSSSSNGDFTLTQHQQQPISVANVFSVGSSTEDSGFQHQQVDTFSSDSHHNNRGEETCSVSSVHDVNETSYPDAVIKEDIPLMSFPINKSSMTSSSECLVISPDCQQPVIDINDTDDNDSNNGQQCLKQPISSSPPDTRPQTSNSLSYQSPSKRSRDESLRCSHCGIIFPDKIMYGLHMGCHAVGKQFQCNVCGEVCTDKHDFMFHFSMGKHRVQPTELR